MKERDTLYRILQWALVEIRHEATQVKNRKIFAIAHTLHNLPLHLLRARNKEDYKVLLAELEEDTEDNEGLTRLISHVKKSIQVDKSGE